jgi:transposase-like protein
MERLPHSKYTKELRLEAVRLVTEGGLSVHEASMRLSLPKSTLENWLRAFKAGKLERRAQQEPRLEIEIRAAHQRTRQTYGPERLQRDLAAHGVCIGVHRIKRLRRKLGLCCKQRRRFKATTDSRHGLPVAANLLGQRFDAPSPSHAWLSDIT